MNKIDFKGRVAIVTGAGAGLGRDYAIELAKRGARVVVNDLGGTTDGVGSNNAVADKVVEEIKAFGGEAVPSYDNVATVEGGQNIVKTAIDAFGKVDILINNAGILRDKSFVKMEEDIWDTVIAVHLKGAYCVTRPAFANMRENKYGRIVMTSSTSGVLGNFGQSNYAAAKMGILGLTNALKIEGAKYNVKINVILPGARTRLTGDMFATEMFKNFKVENITPAVLYMCSEKCQDTGLYINAQGGYFMRSAIVTGPRVSFSGMPTPEDVMEKWEDIRSLDNAVFYEDAGDMYIKLFDAANEGI